MRKRGDLRRLVLESLAHGHWQRPSQLAALPFKRRGQLHAYLLRLVRNGLLEQGQERGRENWIYRLSGAGCRLLLWLQWQERQRDTSSASVSGTHQTSVTNASGIADSKS
jgi:hypothetical protein